jgi:hypothetical protein
MGVWSKGIHDRGLTMKTFLLKIVYWLFREKIWEIKRLQEWSNDQAAAYEEAGNVNYAAICFSRAQGLYEALDILFEGNAF